MSAQLETHLVLNRYCHALLGAAEFASLKNLLRPLSEGPDGSGQSHYFARLATQPGLRVPVERLAHFNIEAPLWVLQGSDRLLGAHVLAAEAGEVIQTAALAVHASLRYGFTVSDLRGMLFPYLAQVEGLKLATPVKSAMSRLKVVRSSRQNWFRCSWPHARASTCIRCTDASRKFCNWRADCSGHEWRGRHFPGRADVGA